MNVFFFTHAEPKFLPPVIIDTTETVCGPRYTNLRTNGRYRFMHTPAGPFDVQQILSKVHSAYLPNLLLVHADSTAGCLPKNLPPNCIKVLLIGDTHHLASPIQKMIQYAGSEAFDAVILWNRQHAHFFTELGFRNVFWMPGLTFAVPTTRQFEEKTNDLCFFGQLGKHHPRRTRIIKSLIDEKIEVTGGTLPRRDSLELVAKSRASLNVSLNGELNLRVFESTQNGALLFSDELSEFAGLQHFFRDNESMVTFADADQLKAKLKSYASRREEAGNIAAKGREITNRHFSYSARRDTFFNLLNGGATSDVFRLKDEPRCRIQASSSENKNATLRRVQIYELAQEMHRTRETPSVILTGGATPFIAADLADLVRMKQTIGIDAEAFEGKTSPLMRQLGVERLARIDPEELATQSGDLIITSEKELISPASFLGKAHPEICIWDYNPDNQAAHARMLDSDYELVTDSIPGHFRLKNN